MTWQDFGCSSSTRRWQVSNSGKIEVDGLGTPTRSDWPIAVDGWSDLIARKSEKYGVPAIWIASIMAIESGGKSDVCYRPGGGQCSTADGAGLMAVLASTAKALIGRSVLPEEMMADPDLAVDLGTMLIKRLKDKYGDDFVKVAMAYNAGSVRCSYGSSGSTVPDSYGDRESCPQTPWGVIMGCVRTSRAINNYCAPSADVEGMYACPVDYPGNAIRTYNAAVEAGWTPYGMGAAGTAKSIVGTLVLFTLGAMVSYGAVQILVPSVR